MIRIKGHEEYEVWCKNCKKTIIFDSPEDLTKENKPDSVFNPMYCVVCPLCGKEIWFDGIFGYTLDPKFAEQVKERSKTKHATVAKRSNEAVLAVTQDCLENMPKSFEECDF